MLVLAALAIAAELATRELVKGFVADFVESEWGGTADVTLGTSPVLPELLSGELAAVTVTADDLSFEQLIGASARADLEDVRWNGGNVAASRAHVEVDVPAEGLERAVVDAIPGDLADVAVTPRPDSDQLELEDEPDGRVTMLVTPRVDGNVVVAAVDDVELAAELPDLDVGLDQADTYELADLSDLELGLRPTRIAVTELGVTLVLASSGEPVNAGLVDVITPIPPSAEFARKYLGD